MSENIGRDRFEVFESGDITILRLEDPKLADTLLVSELEDALLAYIERTKPQKVVVDFSTVTHCSSAVINGLIRAKKRIAEGQGDLKLACMQASIREAYRLLNLDGTVFEIFETLAEATAGFKTE